MKPLTNETLIEVGTKPSGLNWWGHLMNAKDKPTLDDDDDWSSYAKCSKCGTVENTDESIKVCPKAEYIHISVLRSALQAKERDMVETLRKDYPQFVLSEEIKGKYWKEFGSRIYRRSRFLIEKFIDTKLSNLSK